MADDGRFKKLEIMNEVIFWSEWVKLCKELDKNYQKNKGD